MKSSGGLTKLLDRLEKTFGKTEAPPAKDPLSLILWENVGYLVPDEKRALLFLEFKRRVGLDARKILAAPEDLLLELASRGGMRPVDRVARWREIATLALGFFDGDLRGVLGLPLKEARKILRKFPGIGLPGAEKILLFSGTEAVLALDSNGLRVLTRLGYGTEDANYAKSYASAQTAASAELPKEVKALHRASVLLRRHGKEVCRNGNPECPSCPLASVCAFARGQ